MFILAATASNALLGYVYWFAVARSHDAADIGVATAIIPAMLLVSLISQMGTTTGVVQRLARADGTEAWLLALNGALVLGAAAGLVAGGLAAPLIQFIVPELEPLSHPASIILFSVGVALWTGGMVIDFAFLTERAGAHVLTRSIAFNVAKIPLAMLPLIFADGSPLTLLASWVLATLLANGAALGLLLPRFQSSWHIRWRASVREARSMATDFAGHYFTNVGNALPALVLPVLVVSQLSAADNAYFYVAWLMGAVFYLAASAVGQSLFTEGMRSPASVRDKLKKGLRLLVILLAPVAAVYLVAGRPLLGLFGSEYSDGGYGLLVLLTIAGLPTIVVGLYGNVLRVAGRLRASTLLFGMVAVITLGGTLLLLPSQELLAPGYAWLAAQTLGAAWAVIDTVTRTSSNDGSGTPAPEDLSTPAPVSFSA
jgi:O-antigen/teichoic acid export membrane protein